MANFVLWWFNERFSMLLVQHIFHFYLKTCYLPVVGKLELIVDGESVELASVTVGEVSLIVNGHDGLDTVVGDSQISLLQTICFNLKNETITYALCNGSSKKMIRLTI